ncbi:MAG: helix-turn-helix transcriptional regulator [Alphaproteobacteria bacterium]|nr:helix-turn-helix transcriptional regulator [Alphaproteobacteria bacterium]
MKKREAQEISDKIVAILRRVRLEKGITQYKMAKDTGMSKSSILYIENFTQRPSLYTVILLADYLSVDFSEVLKKVNIHN